MRKLALADAHGDDVDMDDHDAMLAALHQEEDDTYHHCHPLCLHLPMMWQWHWILRRHPYQ